MLDGICRKWGTRSESRTMSVAWIQFGEGGIAFISRYFSMSHVAGIRLARQMISQGLNAAFQKRRPSDLRCEALICPRFATRKDHNQ